MHKFARTNVTPKKKKKKINKKKKNGAKTLTHAATAYEYLMDISWFVTMKI